MADEFDFDDPAPQPVRRRPGRPFGSKGKSKTLWRDALRLALMRIHPATGERYIDLIAKRVVVSALQGDMQAVEQIGNRLDGRTVTIEGSDETPVTLVSRIERVIVDVAYDEDGSVKPITH